MNNNGDQDPRKRRRLSLTKKTTTRLKSSMRSASKSIHSPRSSIGNIPMRKKSLRSIRAQHNVDSSDDSSLEIGWDNHSPSSSSCTKQNARSTQEKKNDIASILEKVPKKKKYDGKELQSHGKFNTWMQNDLVASCSSSSTGNCSNRKPKTRSERTGAIALHDDLKNFLKTVKTDDGESLPNGSTPHRRSPQFLRRDAASLINVSPIGRKSMNSPASTPLICRNSSLVNSPLIPDNFDNISWSCLDTSSTKTNINENQCPVTKCFASKTLYKRNSSDTKDDKPTTCKILYKSENKHLSSLEEKQNIVDGGGSCGISLTNIDLGETPCKRPLPKDQKNVADTCVTAKRVSPVCSDSLMNIDFDDDFDEILSTQPLDDLKPISAAASLADDEDDDDDDVIIVSVVAGNNESVKLLPDNILSDSKDLDMLLDDNFPDDIFLHVNDTETRLKPKCDKTPSQGPNVTSNLSVHDGITHMEGIAFDDEADDFFDDIIVSLDGEVKCKSQETPPQSVTSDQRKLKSRCHTSPFPMSSKRTLMSDQSQCALPPENIGSNGTVKECRDDTREKDKNSNGNSDCKENIPKNKTKFSFKKTPISPSVHRSHLQSTLPKAPLNMSVIGKSKNSIESVEELVSFSSCDTTTVGVLTSTQKCTFDEIQRKRELAQMKLKERSKWKK